MLFFTTSIYSAQWKVSKSNTYKRITDCIIRDIDNDNIDEIIISSYSYTGKYVDVYKVNQGELVLIDKLKVPQDTIFFDAGDVDNDKIFDIVFLTSNGLYYSNIKKQMPEKSNKKINYGPGNYYNQNYNNDFIDQRKFNIIPHVKSELVVPQPELLTSVPMVIDLDGDSKNELVIENIRSIEIYETENFKRLSSIKLKTILEFSLIPGQFYPHYIFYTLPIILVIDIDNDNKKEIITKFPRSMNIYSQKGLNNWILKKRINVSQDNVYFLSDSFVKFSFPVIEDIDNDNIKELIISSANLNMPRLRFEAVGDIYYFNKKNISEHKNKQIIVKGIPLNLPVFYNISSNQQKDLICPAIPFNIITIFSILSGQGNIKVPFLYYPQENNAFDTKKPKKIFEIPFRIENIMSFVEELPFDQAEKGQFPDFYYFEHDLKNKKAKIHHYYYDEKKYYTDLINELDIPSYTPALPANLKLGSFSKNKKKDVIFLIHKYFYILSRESD